MSKNVTKIVQTSFEVILSNFFVQCTLKGRNLEKIQKTGKNFNCSKCPKKRSQKQSNMFSTCSEVVFLVKKNDQFTLEGGNLQKTQKSGKTSKLSKFSKNVPKNIVWARFAWLFRRKKAPPSEPWRLKKIHKNRKDFKNSKSRKTLSKVSKLAWGSFFEFFLPSATWRSKFVKLGRKNRKKLNSQECPKIILKVSTQVLNLFSGNFLGKNCPVHPVGSTLGKTSKNWKNFQFFKIPKNVPKSVQTCFQHASR